MDERQSGGARRTEPEPLEEPRATPPAGRRRWFRSSFAVGLVLAAVVGLGIRVAFASSQGSDHSFYDSAFYSGEATALAEGRGFVDPPVYTYGKTPGPAAEHPPLTALVLAPVAKVFPDSQLAMRLTFALLGSVGVVLIGLLGAAVGGSRTGLIAAGLAAVYPFLWVNDGVVMAESLAVVLTTSALLMTYRMLTRPTWTKAVALGALCGLAALARAELLLLAPLLAVGIGLANPGPVRRRCGLGAVAVVVALLVVSPWVAFNLSRFREPVLMTTDGDVNLLASTCDETFYGPHLGSADWRCLIRTTRSEDNSTAAAEYRATAIRYTRAHAGRYAVVVLARLGRDWSFFGLGRSLVPFEGRPRWVTALGLVFYYPMLVLAVGGAVILTRRRVPWWPFLAPPVIVCATALVSWGQPRYRAIAEPCLVVLSAVAICTLWRLAAQRRGLRSRTSQRLPRPEDRHRSAIMSVLCRGPRFLTSARSMGSVASR